MYKKCLRSLIFVVWVIFITCCMTGCGIIDIFYLPRSEDTAQEIYEAANEEMADKNYVAAVELYNKLKDNYPFSPYTIDAELSLGDAYFLDEEYELATETYKDFEALHPRNEAIPYVLYQTGMSLLRQFSSIDRTTTELQEAYDYFDRVCQVYPNSPYAQSAAEHMLMCRKLMAEHELYIGDVFWHMGKYGPAWRRYVYVAENFKDVPEVAEHAQEKSLGAYQRYRAEQAEEIRQEREGSWRKWFNWL